MKKRILIFSLCITLLGITLFSVISAAVYHNNLLESSKNYLRVYMLSYDKREPFEVSDKGAKDFSEEVGGARVTFMTLEGIVVGDSELTDLPSHADRKEVLEALSKGEGFSVRYSKSAKNDFIYYCKLIEDRNLLVRIAIPTSSIWDMFVDILPFTVIFLLVDIILCVVLTNFAVKHVLKPVETFSSKVKDAAGSGDKIVAPYLELEPMAQIMRQMREDNVSHLNRIQIEQQREKIILDNMEHGIAILKSPEKVILINKSAAKLLGYDSKTDKYIMYFLRDRELLKLLETRTNGLVYRIIDGKDFAVRVTNVEEMSAIVVLMTDVSVIKKAERSKDEFIGNVTHEMNTPLTSISGFAELMASGKIKDDKIASTAETILKQSNRLTSLVKSIIDYSAIQNDELPSYDVNLSQIIKDVILIQEPYMNKKNIKITTNIDNSVNVKSRRERITEILENLISNAIRYNVDSGSIDITVDTFDNVPRLKVTDTGIGIEPELIERIFDRFYTVDPSHSGHNGGFGLGLAIVKRIVNISGWKITVESAKKKGATFTILFY